MKRGVARPRPATRHLVLLALAGTALLCLRTPLGTDYPFDAGPSVAALARGDLHAYAGSTPQMGQLTLLARGALAALTGSGGLTAYRLGALLCLLPAAAFAVLLARSAVARGLPQGAAVGLVVVLTANPMTVRALAKGHPEEILGAVLCVGAVVLAPRRPAAAGLLLGLALATKQWALLAVGPVLLAAPAGTRRGLLVRAGGLAGALTLPAFLADPHAFVVAMEKPATGLSEMRPGNLWSLVAAHDLHVATGPAEGETVGLVPGWVRATAHPLVALLGVVLPLAYVRAHGARAPLRDALALLALVFLLRCVLDPWNHGYYHLPFLVTVAALESLALRRAPVVTAAASAVLWVVFARAAPAGAHAADALELAWAIPLGGWLVAMMAGWTRTPTPDPSPAPSPSAAAPART